VDAVGVALFVVIEERALNVELGERYRAFATRRARLIPYLW